MILFYILVFSLPLTNHWLFGYGQGDLTVVKVLALACLPFALYRLLSRFSTLGSRVPGLLPAFTVYSSIALFSFYIVNGNDLGFQLERHNKFSGETADVSIISMLLIFVLMIGLIDSMARLRRVVFTLMGSIAVTSVYVLRDWMLNRGFADYRPGGISGDANYFALCASACLILGLHLALSTRSRWEKLFLYGCLVITSVAFLLAASRGGMLGLAIGLAFLMFRSRRAVGNLVMLAVLFLPLLLVVPNAMIQRFTNPGHGDEQAVQNRETTWAAGLRMIAAHPITGVGLGKFHSVVLAYENLGELPVLTVAHNTYIEVAAELGIPGLLAYLALSLASFRGWSRIIRSKDQFHTPLLGEISLGFQAAFIGASVCAFFVSAWWLRFFWFVLFLPACLPAVEQSVTRQAQVPVLSTDLTVAEGLR